MIYVCGDQGMGKSEILKNCGKYVADRNLVQGVFFIDVKEKLECEPDHQLFQMIEEQFRGTFSHKPGLYFSADFFVE